MNYKQNAIISQSNEADKYHFKRSRVFPPRNKFSEPYHSPSTTNSKPQIRALIDIVPQDQAFIQDYIEELKSKLMQMRLSPNKKSNSPLQNNQQQQRRYENTKQKSAAKIMKDSGQIHATNRSTEFSRKSVNDHRLLDLNSVRDEVKRLKSGVERRVVTEKQNRRYEHQQEQNKHEGNQFNSQRLNYRMRSNTEEVIRSSKNPMRTYRYSSERKTKLGQEKFRSNHKHNQYSDSDYKMNKYSQLQSQSAQKEINSPKQENIKKRPGLQRQRRMDKRQVRPDRVGSQKEKQIGEKIEDLSTIMAKKQTLNFLGDSCVAIKEQLQTYKKGTAKFLDFLDWKTKQLKDVYLNCKQKKRRWELDKLSKIFPKGFFI